MMVYERHDYNGTSFLSVNIPLTLGGKVSASVCTSARSYRTAGMRQEYVHRGSFSPTDRYTDSETERQT